MMKKWQKKKRFFWNYGCLHYIFVTVKQGENRPQHRLHTHKREIPRPTRVVARTPDAFNLPSTMIHKTLN
jgi:hypothetical protein